MDERTARVAREMLMEIGVQTNLRGFGLIIDAIDILLKNPNANTVKDVYFTVGKKNDISTVAVERDIRHAIERTFANGNVSALETMFKSQIKPGSGKVTNRAFLNTLAIRVKDWEKTDCKSAVAYGEKAKYTLIIVRGGGEVVDTIRTDGHLLQQAKNVLMGT